MSTLDKHMLKELLLVCSALGSVESEQQVGDDQGPHEQHFVRGENCLEWLQDLQRFVRSWSSFKLRALCRTKTCFVRSYS